MEGQRWREQGKAASLPVPGRAGRRSSFHPCQAQGWAPGCLARLSPVLRWVTIKQPRVTLPCLSGYGKGLKREGAVVTVGSCPS